MRATAHCANHPSREAELRCTDCGKWVCERCARDHHDRIFCSSSCRWKSTLRNAKILTTSLLRRTIEPAWSIAVVTALSVLLVVAIGRLVADLMEVWSPADVGIVEVAVPIPARPIAGRFVPDGDGWRLEIEGEPESAVLVGVAGQPPIVVTLDRRGRAVVDHDDVPMHRPSIELRGLGNQRTDVVVPATVTPTATATAKRTVTPTHTASATAILTATSTGIPAATSTPTVVVTQTPEVATRRPSPTHTQVPRRPSSTPEAVDQMPALPSPPVLHLVDDAGPRLALTFDGASSANGTHDLLDLLQQLDLTVTLFVTGGFIEKHPAVVRRAVLAGHEVGNHSFSHPRLTSYAQNNRHDLLPNVTRSWLQDELRRTERAFRAATGRSMAPLWRAPYGEENSTLRGWAMELGYLHIRWSSLQGKSLDSLDWVEDEHSSLYFDSTRLVDRLLAFPKMEGGIVLMHLATDREVPPWSELPRFTREVQNRGVEVTTVTELLTRSKKWRPWLEKAAKRHSTVFPASDSR
jgi:peptidoglycan/xylan/chitin deacetylase (PgdA/CDA1 family)